MGMSKWKRAKLALGCRTCLYLPQTSDEPPSSSSTPSPTGVVVSEEGPTTPTPSSFSGIERGPTISSKTTCSICLSIMKPGHRHAIFTAECSHSFHFHCITSNVKHGSHICPVCRAKWKEVPFPSAASSPLRIILRRNPPPPLGLSPPISSVFRTPVSETFDDHEDQSFNNNCVGIIDVKAYPEVPAVKRSSSYDNFSVVIHLKGPLTSARQHTSRRAVSENCRAPVDLVTILDVSGSTSGPNLALLKRAMRFVVLNLGPSDRLSVLSFSSTARRLFALRHMTENGREETLEAVNSLVPNGGTNIAEALRRATKVLMDRKSKNAACSIILLSDGLDTHISGPGGIYPFRDSAGWDIPIHTIGIGVDPDAAVMHSISEVSGGTFSYIQDESMIQDAFARCIGGLLSVVVQELKVTIECVHQRLHLGSIKAGSYKTSMRTDARMGSINVGDLYAEEARDFLVTINIPVDESSNVMSLVKVRCHYRDSLTKEMVNMNEAAEVTIKRPEVAGLVIVSMEVDRQRNRLRAAEAMAEARVTADSGDLAGAVFLLESCYRVLSGTCSARAGDRLSVALLAELKEMQKRMGNCIAYVERGRAYILSGLSSLSWQRVTTRGNPRERTSLLQLYQTPTMVDMLKRSQTMLLRNVLQDKP